MTKEAYLDMCEALGSEPIDKEIPREYDELTLQSQDAIDIFNMLPDRWNSMSGTYIGKDISNIGLFFDLLNITDKTEQLLVFTLLTALLNEHIEQVNKQIAQKTKKVEKANTNPEVN